MATSLDDIYSMGFASKKQDQPQSSGRDSSGIEGLIRSKAQEYGIDEDLFVSLAKRESGLNPTAKNPGSSAGGLFQFIDNTWKQYGRGDKFDPEANADAAARMYKENLDRFGGDDRLALAAHHVGPGKAQEAMRNRKIGDKDVSTQVWLNDILKGSGKEFKPAFDPLYQGEQPVDMSDAIGMERRAKAQAKADASPLGTSWNRGIEGLTHSAGLAWDNLTGDFDGAAERIQNKRIFDHENPAPSSSQKFIKDWDAVAEDDYAGMFGAVLKNPAGSLNQMLEQTPNSLPGMTFQIAAGVASKGLLALGPVGAAAGLALQGMAAFAGNFLPEGGAVIEERMRKDGVDTNNLSSMTQWLEKNQGENLSAGAKKAGVISATDAVTGWIGMKMLAAPSVRFAQAERKFFADSGVDVKNASALQAARATDAYKATMQPFAAELVNATKGAGMIGRGAMSAGLDAIGEGVGEYYGSVAANGEGSVKEAILEGLMSVGQGAGMAGSSYGLGKLSGPDQNKQALNELAQYQPQPNAPLTNAAGAANVSALNQPTQHASTDPFAQMIAPLTERFNDRALFQAIRENPNLGPDALSDILASYRVATNNAADPKQRQAAIDRLTQFFSLYENQPNFTVQPNTPESNLPAVVGNQSTSVGPVDPSAGSINGQSSRVVDPKRLGVAPRQITGPSPALIADNREAQRIVAEYEQAYQDLVKADQLGASDQELMQRQINLRDKEDRLQELNRTIEEGRALETANKRDELLSYVLSNLKEGQNPSRAFDKALKIAGFTDTAFTEAEKKKISRYLELAQSGIAPPAEQQPAQVKDTTRSRMNNIAGMIGNGWIYDGRRKLLGPNGKVYELQGNGERQYAKTQFAKFKAKQAKQQPVSAPVNAPVAQEVAQPNEAQVGAGQEQDGLIAQILSIAKRWDRENRTSRGIEWMAGAAEANTSINALSGTDIPAHGMAKVATLQEAISNLVSMVNGGIRPGLYVDWLAPHGQTHGSTGTAGGHAYRDGPFILAFRRGLDLDNITSADVTGILVNPANQELVWPLQQMFPNITVRSYMDAADLVQSNEEVSRAPETQVPSEATIQAEAPSVPVQSEVVAQPSPVAESVPDPVVSPNVERKQAKPISQWTREELQARLDRGNLSDESRAKLEEELAKRPAPAAKKAKPEAQMSVGKAPGDSQPVSVRSGVVHIGEDPVLDYDTEEEVRVKDGATNQEIADAIKASGQLGSRKIFGLAPKKDLDAIKKKWKGEKSDSVSQQKTDAAPEAAQDKAEPVTQENTQQQPNSETIPALNDANSANSDFERGKAMMGDGIDKLIGLLGGKTNMLPEEEAQIIPVMSQIFRGAALMGYSKFKDAARFVLDTLRSKAPDVAAKIDIDNLQAGYINAMKNIEEPSTKAEVIEFDSVDQLYEQREELAKRIEEAEKQTDHDATPAKKEAGNYKKGKFAWNGLTISVETAKGEDRTDKETNGDKWRVTMPATYGYFNGTVGADKDHVDVFMGQNPESDKVFIVNQTQVDSTKFDEHKIMAGFASLEDAKAAYLGSFESGFGDRVLGSISGPYSVAEFKELIPSLKKAKAVDDRKAFESERFSSAVKSESEPAEFEHSGYKIYKNKINIKGEGVKEMWAVQTEENRQKNRVGFGDNLFNDKEQAIAAAERQSKDAEANLEWEAKQKEKLAEEERKKQEIKADTYSGFLDDKSPAKQGLIRKVLDKQWRFDGEVMTARQRIDRLKENGSLEVETYEEPKIKPMSRTQFNRASQREQDAHEKKMREAGNKTVYLVNGSDLGKIAYDYANYLLGNAENNAENFVPLDQITVTLKAKEAETGRTVEYDEKADAALKEIDDQMNLARSLLQCLAS